MITRGELNYRRCVAGLISVVEQVPLRASVRGPLPIDDATAGLLLLWSALRWERTFAIRTLESLRVDLWLLTQEVDEAIKACGARGRELSAAGPPASLDLRVRKWLDAAAEQARSLQHDYVGIEHVLLALLARDSPPFAAIFHSCGLSFNALKQGIVAGLAQASVPLLTLVEAPAVSSDCAPPPGKEAAATSWIAEIDRPAVGVPRRFGMFLMMMMVTFYAVLFSMLKVLNASAVVFVLIALLFTGIGVGQAVLFDGRYPRAASIRIGLVLVPVELLAFCMFHNDFVYFGNMTGGEIFGASIAMILAGVPLGAIFGYLFGTLAAGGFYLEDWYEKRRQRL